MRTRFRATARRSTSPPPSTACCATSCSTRGACSRAPSCSSTSGSTTSAATPGCSRPTSATCARSSTCAGRRSSTPCAASATRCARRGPRGMASLRARLLAAVLVLSAAGLLLVGAITYAEQRSFLLDRVDAQARSAPPAVARALADAGVGPRLPDPDHDQRPGDRDRPGGPPPGGGEQRFVPQGTYAERRDASGKVLGHRVFDYGEAIEANPALPASVPVDRV